jgi:fructose-specific phosphotransferase system IIC component
MGYEPIPGGPEWIKVMVEIERPPATELEPLSRSARYRRLKANAQQHRTELEEWVHDKGLDNEVQTIGEATAFNLLFAIITPKAAEALVDAPGVVAVMAGEVPVEPLRTAYA